MALNTIQLRPGQVRCHWCSEASMPMMTVRGPEAFREDAVVRHFCCLRCYWNWVESTIEERNAGGRLDRAMNWERRAAGVGG